jgi:hypothetical protein
VRSCAKSLSRACAVAALQLTVWKPIFAKTGSMANARKDKRKSVETEGMVYDLQGKPLVAVKLRNVSVGGAQLELSQEIDLPVAFQLALTRDTAVRRSCKRVWQFATVAGVSFYQRSER